MSPTMCICTVPITAHLLTVTAAIAKSSALKSGMAKPPIDRGSAAKSASIQARMPVISAENCPCHT
ncbi:hypothetical protein PF003_g21382 [Phytophthora fragariae]|uniref:RxLR effector protein n=1 Tax=Phytophthora fragariae TaxID=53985 RepID=A0A6A3DDK2_9STRA|nr:hypothetical protein PF003_g21382 [Phytophthora fragariae]KAE8918356.1 hypothetical protein PF009_g31328 [Phytophthora fragariae]